MCPVAVLLLCEVKVKNVGEPKPSRAVSPGHVTLAMSLLHVGHVIPSGGLLGNNLKDF